MIEYTQREERRDRAREERKDAAIGITWSAFVLFQFARAVKARLNLKNYTHRRKKTLREKDPSSDSPWLLVSLQSDWT